MKERKCIVCSNKFFGVTNSKLCSDKCRKQKLVTWSLDYYKKNKDKIYSRLKKLREEETYKKLQKTWNNKWREKNKEKVLEIRRRSQNKIRKLLKVSGFVTEEIKIKVLKRDKNTCLCCGSTKSLTIDHIIPISVGGVTVVDNLQTLCRSCNSRKQQKTIDYRV